MTKGTPSKGIRGRKARLHIACRRCGKTAYHTKRRICANCGYGNSAKLRKYSWNKKDPLKR